MAAPHRNGPTRIAAVLNQKGGVGKTTIALHLALAARDAGQSVLFVDFDTQGTASVLLARSAEIASRPGGAEQLFGEDPPAPQTTPLGIDLLHGHQHLDSLDRRTDLFAAQQLAPRLTGLAYDWIVFDTPPAIGIRHLAPLLWADRVLTPLEPTGASIQGLAQTRSALRLARKVNPRLVSLVLINRLILRSSTHQHHLRELARRVDLVRPYLTNRVAVGDALDAGQPVWAYPRATREVQDKWRGLFEELLQ